MEILSADEPCFSAGSLTVRPARNRDEVRLAQRLRYEVFFGELRGEHDPNGTDADAYDDACRHLIAFDSSLPPERSAVGTYRLIDRAAAASVGAFYSESEFDLSPLLRRQELKLLEVGRSCVHRDYRTQGVMQMLWRGLAAYLRRYEIDVMFGCASFAGTDPAAVAPALRVLHDRHAAGPEWGGVRAHPDRHIPLDTAPAVMPEPPLPPLIKGYLRLGAKIADGAVLDAQFGSIDVCILLATDKIPGRYENFFNPGRGGAL